MTTFPDIRDMDNKEFWDRVKSLLTKKGIKQTEFSESIGVSIGVFKNWIYRNILPNVEQGTKIAKSLHTSVEFLVIGKDSSKISQEESILLEKWHKIDEGTKRSVNLLIDASISAANEQDSRNERISV